MYSSLYRNVDVLIQCTATQPGNTAEVAQTVFHGGARILQLPFQKNVHELHIVCVH